MRLLSALLGVWLVVACQGFAGEVRYGGRTQGEWKGELGHQDPVARYAATDAMTHFGSKGLEVLTGLLGDKDADTRELAGKVLRSSVGRMGSKAKEAVPALVEAMGDTKDPERSTRVYAAQALGRMGAESRAAIPALREVVLDLGGWDSSPACAAARALWGIGPEGRAIVPELMERLGSEDAETRERAAVALGGMAPGAKMAIPALAELLGDEDSDVRFAAATALLDMRSEIEGALPAVTKIMRSEDADRRSSASLILDSMGPRAVPLLTEMLRHEEDDVREMAVGLAGQMGPDAAETIPVLVELMKDTDEEHYRISSDAVYALREMGPAAKVAIPELTEMLGHADLSVRSRAAEALLEMRPEGKVAIPFVVEEILEGRDSSVSHSWFNALARLGPDAKAAVPRLVKLLDSRVGGCAAARVLGSIGPEAKAAIPELERLLAHENEYFRVAAAGALVEIGPPAEPPISTLVELLQSDTAQIRLAAARALGTVGAEAKAAVPGLVELVQDKDREVRKAVRKSPAPVEWARRADRDVRTTAAEALGKIGAEAKAAIPSLVEAIRDDDRKVRRTAGEALGKMGPGAREAIGVLLELLRDEDRSVRVDAALGLGEMGPEFISVLPEVLRVDDASVRHYVAQVLGGTTARHYNYQVSRGAGTETKAAAMTILVEMLGDEKWYVREAAVEVLGEMVPEAKVVAPSLVEMLEDDDSSVREAAARALGNLGPAARAAIPGLKRRLEDRDWLVGDEAGWALRRIGGEDQRFAATGWFSEKGRPVMRVPELESGPVIDGKLDEAGWKKAATSGKLKADGKRVTASRTEAFAFRDAEHLYIGVACGAGEGESETKPAGEAAKGAERDRVALLIDSNLDRNSYYSIVLTREGTVEASYNEHSPPWQDLTWNRRKPRFRAVTAVTEEGWSAEFSLPLAIFDKNKTLGPGMGFNVRRFEAGTGQTQSWCGEFSNPADAGVLAGIPAREGFAVPPPTNYAGCYRLDGGYRQGFNILPNSGPAGTGKPAIRLGPGSTHPGATGEVRIELEEFLLGGNVHARSLIWDLAVDEKKGEVYVLSAARRKSAIELRVFDRGGKYLRTVMPFNPSLPRDGVKDLCRKRVLEGGVELAVPTLFETCATEPSLYGEYWHLPQSLAIAPNGDLIMSNIFKRTLWRMRPDGSLPQEGWTSIYNPRRNEPFEQAGWLIGPWHAVGLKPYLSYGKFCLPDFCFDERGHLYVSGGVWSPLSQFYSTNWEVPGRGQGEAVWKYRLQEGTELEGVRDFTPNGEPRTKTNGRHLLGVEGQAGTDHAHFNQPCGLAMDGTHLIVADSGNNRVQVFEENGRLAGSITSFEREGRDVPLGNPTALAIDRRRHLYVLALVESERRLIKLESWREPRLLAVSEPLDPDAVRIAVDGGVEPALVWIANGAGRGTLLQLAGDSLSLKGEWADDDDKLSSPGQYGYLPILNIDPQTGDLYVEDDSYYHRSVYGTVYRADQSGKVLKKWAPMPYQSLPDWNGEPVYSQAHATPVFRYPEEPLFLDSFFGKDGRVYRWKRGETTVEILRSDRGGKPIPFEATGTNVLVVDKRPEGSQRNHFVYRGMDVDAEGNIYHVNSRDAVDVFDSDGNLGKPGLLQLIDTRSLIVDQAGNLYVLSCPKGPTQTEEGDWTARHLWLSKYPPTGEKPIWSRPWEGILGCGAGRVGWMKTTCVCLTARIHQALDGKGHLYVANKFSVGVIDCETGRTVGEFGSYGNMDCIGDGGHYPHPELAFGTISALAVWKDRIFVVDAMNARIAKCRITYGDGEE